jgi:hypothetical protein
VAILVSAVVRPLIPPPTSPLRLVCAFPRDSRAGLLAPEEAVALSERRAATLRAMFPLLFSRHARRADLWQAVVIERYLSQAANVSDLEQRIQEVQRRRQQFSWSE